MSWLQQNNKAILLLQNVFDTMGFCGKFWVHPESHVGFHTPDCASIELHPCGTLKRSSKHAPSAMVSSLRISGLVCVWVCANIVVSKLSSSRQYLKKYCTFGLVQSNAFVCILLFIKPELNLFPDRKAWAQYKNNKVHQKQRNLPFMNNNSVFAFNYLQLFKFLLFLNSSCHCSFCSSVSSLIIPFLYFFHFILVFSFPAVRALSNLVLSVLLHTSCLVSFSLVCAYVYV